MNRIFIPYFLIFLIFYIFKIYLVHGINFQRNCVPSFVNCRSNIFNKRKYGNALFCYKKKVKAKELRKLTTEQLEKEIVKCRLDIQLFQQQGFYDMHNYNVYYEKNARRKLAQLLTIYYERYLDNNVRIKN
ncbi:50S ribosomal protein L29, putative [Plasmodium chabaudi chabaudi]|uniref:50S ribosomal protein L29, putative n=1 Tax=Plasmodium chabaudi chabaudi TaxID=31271 RepID=A0A1C6Y8M3_PLACU|nr:50S ribosomal protein L29, putative [Plasmodium chabaudi chabaudi]SCN58938.1 50S ribosomal protein L29, putative [Plasmodium chabaudi chabaudi]